jgi:hypothetical protein
VLSHLSIQIDPCVVLGVAPGASLQEIRDAYRRKAKLLHPDVGGEEWAFRILVQSYEVLSTARVVQASQAEFRAQPPRPQSPTSQAGPQPHDRTNTVRPGVRDAVLDPARVVDVEQLCVRFEVDHLWLLHAGAGGKEDRFLSCCLNISWPHTASAGQAGPGTGIDIGALPDVEQILAKLSEAFEAVRSRTKAASAWHATEEHRFQGWLSYPNTQLAGSGFLKLYDALKARGFSVNQWTRDLIIPREWR